MRILYGIQGTGNGHISRAMEIIPRLMQRAEVEVLVSGSQHQMTLPFKVHHRKEGLGFVFGKKGGIDLLETYKKSKLRRMYKEVQSLDLSGFDLVISDFEPIVAWAALQQGVCSVGLSNQAALISPETPKAKSEDLIGRFLIHHYAPCTLQFGFGYERYNDRIYHPVIRRELRDCHIENKGHHTVYLPAYGEKQILKVLGALKDQRWEVFIKGINKPRVYNNVYLRPLENTSFLKSMSSAAGVVCAAGFGTTTEALYLGKKLLVIPQRHQYEQACNTAALERLGVKNIKSLKKKHLPSINEWLSSAKSVKMDYEDQLDVLLDDLLMDATQQGDAYIEYLQSGQYATQQPFVLKYKQVV